MQSLVVMIPQNAFHRLRRGFLVRRWRQGVSFSAQSVGRWTAVVAYSVLALGIPLPMPAGKMSGGLYPCMNHRCGCQSAEQCWRDCCCMSLEERLIWARQNHVRPPDFVLAQARAAGIQWAVNWPGETKPADASRWASASNEGASGEVVSSGADHGCQKSSGHCACCQRAAEKQACVVCESDEGSPTARQEKRVSGVLLFEALKCHGVSENWQGLAVSLPPPTVFHVEYVDDRAGAVDFSAPQWTAISFPPDVPPPRVLVRG